MLLKIFMTSLVLLAAATVAQARKIQNLEAGSYVLTSGPKKLCGNFSLDSKDLEAKTLSLGAQYIYETTNSTHNTPSDIDEDCEFRERNTRDDRDNEVVLTRENEEVCKGRTTSHTVSRATLSPGEIQIHHEISDGAPDYTCIFKKQKRH